MEDVACVNVNAPKDSQFPMDLLRLESLVVELVHSLVGDVSRSDDDHTMVEGIMDQMASQGDMLDFPRILKDRLRLLSPVVELSVSVNRYPGIGILEVIDTSSYHHNQKASIYDRQFLDILRTALKLFEGIFDMVNYTQLETRIFTRFIHRMKCYDK